MCNGIKSVEIVIGNNHFYRDTGANKGFGKSIRNIQKSKMNDGKTKISKKHQVSDLCNKISKK